MLRCGRASSGSSAGFGATGVPNCPRARCRPSTRRCILDTHSVPVIWRKVEDQEERLRRLTTEQQRLLDFLGSHTKAAIRGIAGSGKTILALAKAQETARRGLRTLFLCYNQPLKEWLRQAIPETFGDNLVIDNYHGMVEGSLPRGGHTVSAGRASRRR